MKRISCWARHHPLKARSIIVLIHLILILLAFYTGTSLRELDIIIPWSTVVLTMVLFLGAAAFYPGRGSRQYRRRKVSDLILAACSFFMIAGLCNKEGLPGMAAGYSYGSDLGGETSSSGKPTAEEILATHPVKGKDHLSRQERKILKTEFRKQLKNYAKALARGDDRGVEKALLIMLSIIAAIGLIGLLGALACSISCSGSPGLAFILFLLGTTGVVIALVIGIKGISRIGKHKPADPKDATKPNNSAMLFMPAGPIM